MHTLQNSLFILFISVLTEMTNDYKIKSVRIRRTWLFYSRSEESYGFRRNG